MEHEAVEAQDLAAAIGTAQKEGAITQESLPVLARALLTAASHSQVDALSAGAPLLYAFVASKAALTPEVELLVRLLLAWLFQPLS